MNDNFLIIVNPLSGNGKPLKVLRVVKKVFDENSVKYSVLISSSKECVEDFLSSGVKEGFKRLLLLGGDGTVNEALQHIVDRKDLIIAVLPVGSGNDMAKNIGFKPPFRKEYIYGILNGEEKAIDIGVCNGRYFSNAVGIGFDAKVAFDYNKSLFLRGKAKYLFQIFKNIVFYKSRQMEIKDFLPLQRVFLISIGNGKTTGGGVPLTLNAEIDDGLLDVCVIKETGIFERVQNLSKGLKGEHLSLPFVKYFQSDSLKIKAETEMIAHIDGEIFKAADFEISILPSKVKFLFNKLKN
ncbi:MAG: diacylglycerol/lipid kinase family protein [Brevinematia bacterium]